MFLVTLFAAAAAAGLLGSLVGLGGGVLIVPLLTIAGALLLGIGLALAAALRRTS